MPQKVFSINAEGEMDYLNPQWEEFTGISTPELNRVTLAGIIHPDGYEENLKKWHEAIETGSNFIYEHRFRNKNGEYIWHLTRALPLKDEHGKIVRWIGTMTDIHSQKQNEQKKDEFISIASHELKTPLTTIKIFFQLIRKEITEQQKTYQFADKASKQLNRLEKLVEDLLDVSKINAGKMQYNLEDFNFQEMLDDAIESVQESSKQHKIILEGNVNHFFNGDRHRLEQVVINLLNNAVKYSPDSDKVIISCAVLPGELSITVKDFGIGISKEHIHNLFDRFYRVDNQSNRFQGLGLGLFISAEIIKRHNGTLKIESEPGQGTIACFTLPLNK